MPRPKLMSYTAQLSQGWFVPSTVAGLPRYVHMLNFEDVHSPVDKACVMIASWFFRYSLLLYINRVQKCGGDSLVFEEGYGLTTPSICCGDDIT